MKNIAVYLGSAPGCNEIYKGLAYELGFRLAKAGLTLVYGGATGGLMTRTSNAAKAAGATVIGVIPPRIKAAGRKADNCDELYMVQNMSERKQIMRDMADVIVCLPGSYGTLDEMMDATSSAIVGEHHKKTL